jgi:hypothetical protein
MPFTDVEAATLSAWVHGMGALKLTSISSAAPRTSVFVELRERSWESTFPFRESTNQQEQDGLTQLVVKDILMEMRSFVAIVAPLAGLIMVITPLAKTSTKKDALLVVSNPVPKATVVNKELGGGVREFTIWADVLTGTLEPLYLK